MRETTSAPLDFLLDIFGVPGETLDGNRNLDKRNYKGSQKKNPIHGSKHLRILHNDC